MIDITISRTASIMEALIKIDKNNKGFLIVLNEEQKVIGVITDGDIRRLFIQGFVASDSIIFKSSLKYLKDTDNFHEICDLFKNEKTSFLPICDCKMKFISVITKKQFHSLLLHDKDWNLSDDFTKINENEVDFEIYNKP